MKFTLFRCFLAVTLTLASSIPCWSQRKDNDIKFRLAQSYERGGDIESALKIYAELYAKDSTNVVYFESLRRDYLQLKRYDDVIALFQRAVAKNPNDMSLLAQLGTFYMQKNDEKSANESWDRALATDPNHEQTYRVVASTMAESRLFEKAIAVYEKARVACRNATLFSNELALLDAIVLNFTGATREYLTMLRQSPTMLSFIQSRMSAYTGRPEGLRAAITLIEEAVKKDPDSLAFLQLQSWAYMEGKQFDRAYDVTKTIDTKTHSGGRELYNFAEHALKEKAYAAAASAFQDVVATYPKFDMRPQAQFGLAHTLQDSMLSRDTVTAFSMYLGRSAPSPADQHRYDVIIDAYKKVIAQYPSTQIAAQSLLSIAVIQQEHAFDLQSAQSSLETLINNYAAYPGTIMEGRLRLGDVLLSRGNTAKAEEQYLLLNNYPGGSDQKERAGFRLAEIDYYKGNFKESLKKLKALSINVIADIANDALKLQIFISDNTASGDADLRRFAAADFLKRQMKYNESIDAFESMIVALPKSTLVDEAVMNIGDIQLQLRQYDAGIASYEKLIKDFPESLSLDIAVVKIGTAYDLGLHNMTKAIESYQRLLTQYPNSIYVSDVRQRIRALRGETI